MCDASNFGIDAALLQSHHGTKVDIDQSRINNLQHYPLYLDCQNNHFEVDLLGKPTFKPIPFSTWTKNNTQQKQFRPQPY